MPSMILINSRFSQILALLILWNALYGVCLDTGTRSILENLGVSRATQGTDWTKAHYLLATGRASQSPSHHVFGSLAMSMPQGFVNKPLAQFSAEAMLRAGVMVLADPLWDRGAWVQWKSGAAAPVFMDTRRLLSAPVEQRLVVAGLARIAEDQFKGKFDALAGISDGHWWAGLVAAKLGMPWFYVRKERKAYGPSARDQGGLLASGVLRPGTKVLLLDDGVVSGQSAATAADLIKAAGHEVVGFISITNVGKQEMFDRMSSRYIAPKTLVTYFELLAAGVQMRLLTPEAAAELRAFYSDPDGHRWNFSMLMHRKNRAIGH
jgi:orotate phosphoribosyltransferase